MVKAILRQLFGRGRPDTPAGVNHATPVASAHAARGDAGPGDDSAERAALAQARSRQAALDVTGALALVVPFLETTRSVETLVFAGRMAMFQGDFDTARARYARAEKIASDAPAVWSAMAELHHLRRDHVAELPYRRNLVFLSARPTARAYVGWLWCIVNASGQGANVSLSEVELVVGKFRDAAELTPALQMEFAEHLYSVKRLVPRARELYLQAASAAAGQVDRSMAWMKLDAWVAQSGAPVRRDDGTPERPFAVAELQDVCPLAGFQWVPLVAERSIALDGFLTRRIRLQRELPESPVLLSGFRSLELRCDEAVDELATPALLLGGVPNYYHHTIEHLSRLAVAEALQVDPGLPVVVNDDLAPFQQQQLALLGYADDRIIRLKPGGRLTSFRKLTVPTVPVEGGEWMSPLIPQWARRRLVPLASGQGGAPTPRGRRLYLSRRGASRRRVANEDALVDALAAQGFERIDPERLDVVEQIRLFSGAEIVVSPTGAALTNMIFMPPGATVIVLYGDYAKASIGGLYFDALAEACGHRYEALSGPAVAFGSKQAVDGDFRIDPAQLLALLER